MGCVVWGVWCGVCGVGCVVWGVWCGVWGAYTIQNIIFDLLIEAYCPGFCTKRLTQDLNHDLKVKILVQFQSLNLD